MELYMGTFKFLAISDIHLGHRKVAADSIINNLKTVINDSLLSEIDMLIIAGDLFDRLLNYSDMDVFHIQKYFIELLTTCSLYKVSIRVLEGTPLHDRGQAMHLSSLCDIPSLHVDFLYVDKVYIEKNEKYSLNILYVPDEWHPDPNQTWLDVMEELSFNELKSVDLSIMHGMFEHQVPSCSSIIPHSNARYESITDKYIIIGHIHQPTFHGKILAPGSFDRLAHDDEGTKGCWKVEFSKNKRSDKIEFIENKGATVFKTINCCGLSFEAAIERISTLDAKPESHIRIKTFETDNTVAILEWCKKTFYNYKWKVKIESNKNKDKKNSMQILKPEKHESINPNSIHSLLLKRMQRNGCSETLILEATEILKEIT